MDRRWIRTFTLKTLLPDIHFYTLTAAVELVRIPVSNCIDFNGEYITLLPPQGFPPDCTKLLCRRYTNENMNIHGAKARREKM